MEEIAQYAFLLCREVVELKIRLRNAEAEIQHLKNLIHEAGFKVGLLPKVVFMKKGSDGSET